MLSESEYEAAASNGWDPLIEYIESRDYSSSGHGFSRGSSSSRGVTWNKTKMKWVAQIAVLGKQVQVYTGENEEEATLAYDSANQFLHGNTPE